MSDEIQELIDDAILSAADGWMNDAHAQITRAVELARRASRPPILASALCEFARIEEQAGNSDEVCAAYEEAVVILREGFNPLKLADVLCSLGNHHHERDEAKSQAYYAEALTIYRRCTATPKLSLAHAVRSLAVSKHQTGARDEAAQLWEEARQLYLMAGDPLLARHCANRLTWLERTKGR